VIAQSPLQLAFLITAGLIAGAVNAVAGGGSLLVFPALLAVGFPPLAANVTNSVAQWPGYLGVVAGARHELPGLGRRLVLTSTVAVFGSAVGIIAGRTVTRHGRPFPVTAAVIPGGAAVLYVRP